MRKLVSFPVRKQGNSGNKHFIKGFYESFDMLCFTLRLVAFSYKGIQTYIYEETRKYHFIKWFDESFDMLHSTASSTKNTSKLGFHELFDIKVDFSQTAKTS